MWTLIYLSTVMASWTSIGMMVEGNFETQQACLEYASEQWSEEKGLDHDPRSMIFAGKERNFFISSSKIYYVESPSSDMGTYYSCVKPRKIRQDD